MNNIEIKQKINEKLDLLNTEELTLIDNLLNQITSFITTKSEEIVQGILSRKDLG
jgi:hypothetical protein